MDIKTNGTLQTITIERTHNGAVSQITLGGSKGNILSGVMMRELRNSLAVIGGDINVKLVAIAGEGKHFSFGASVEEHRREHAAGMIKEFHGLILDIARLRVPVLTSVSGFCLGGAMELALAGSLIFADETAMFGQPEILLGVFPPPASVLLPLRIGFARAEELLITGENIGAARAYEIGLVNKLFPSGVVLRAGVEEWIAKNILPKSAASLRMAVCAERLRLIGE